MIVHFSTIVLTCCDWLWWIWLRPMAG